MGLYGDGLRERMVASEVQQLRDRARTGRHRG
jgi:hypothetical protein